MIICSCQASQTLGMHDGEVLPFLLDGEMHDCVKGKGKNMPCWDRERIKGSRHQGDQGMIHVSYLSSYLCMIPTYARYDQRGCSSLNQRVLSISTNYLIDTSR